MYLVIADFMVKYITREKPDVDYVIITKRTLLEKFEESESFYG